MRKNYALFIIFLICLLQISQDSYSQGSSQKLVLNPSMVTNESAYGDPGMLVDEQAIANDPLNGAGGAPQTNWFPGWGDKHPASAYIDLGKVYELTHVSLYDNNGKGDFIVEQGTPGNWAPLFTDPLNYYQVWNNNEVLATTRYLRFTRVTTSSNAHELVLYGSVVNAPPVLTAVGEQVVGEGETLTLLLAATDPDNGSLSFSLDSNAEFITLNDNGDGSATLTANPPNGSAGVYTVNVTITDSSGGQTIESFILTVNNSETGNPPSTTDPLQVIGIDFHDWRNSTPSNWNGLSERAVGGTVANLKNLTGQNTSYSITVTDTFNGTGLSNLSTGNDSGPVPDGVMSTFWYNQYNHGILKLILDKTKKYTFKIYGGRDGTNDDKSADYTIGEQTVSLYNFNNTQNAAVIENVIPDANNEVFLSMTNSTGYTYAILNGIVIEEYAVAPTNTPPVLASIGNQTIIEGELLNIPLSATDSDSDPLSFSLSTAADFISLMDNGDGTAVLSSTGGEVVIGNYELTVSVSDGNGGVGSEIFEVSFVPDEGEVPDAIEYQALVDLYNSAGGDEWTNNTNWMVGTSSGEFDNWHGVTVANGDVTQILLSNNELTGSIPLSIKNLRSLSNLNLSVNSLTGPVPHSIGDLINLKILQLSFNFLESIPESLTDLTNLERLHLSYNFILRGEIPSEIDKLSKLTHFYAENNSLTGSIPSSIGNLDSLKVLYLSHNFISGQIPTEIGSCENLEYLVLHSNDIIGEIPQTIGNLLSLIQINMSYNQIGGAIPETLSNLSNLRYLLLDGNILEGDIPQDIVE